LTQDSRQRMLSPIRRTLSVAIVAAAIAVAAVSGQSSPLPNQAGSLKFAAIGDNGTGEQPEYDIGRQMAAFHATFPFDLVIMLGDNMYGGQTPKDFVTKFERPCSRPA
jgi:hypothetical protein